ncbi:DUF5602 domain-containing protein [Marinobacter sp. SS21]|uniref:DUF5602 domain-containing protein n=1 Tax=Marinobacter sp. SS21 TaxID=2979460 RepID=UPI00232C739D|nr:DUF5602 domain-containing protein [Marinobacter sp. SS21]MDC0663562.1 DUF5602 domain-containing protein [Marinobacter sp. SS21]
MKTALSQRHTACSIYALALIGLNDLAFATEPSMFNGPPVAVGDGTARVMVVVNDTNEPESISVVMTKDALQGLPEAQADQSVWIFPLPLPDAGPNTGYDHVVLDWNPAGHEPEGVYSVPHFDVHFYLIDHETREAITFRGEDRAMAMAAPDPQLLPEGYVIPPDTEVEQMGMHALDPAGEEFHGRPFSHNLIYGYYKGQLIFIEPMVSLAFLQLLPEMTASIKRPQTYSYPGWYPASYRIEFDVGNGEYSIALEKLQRFD